MQRQSIRSINRELERLAHQVTKWTGSSPAFVVALLMTVVWLVVGPLCGFSDTWQLVMNTVSSIVTFLMVFLIQRSQNKDNLAMQVKLNEIIAAMQGASNRLINVEDLSEEEVRRLHERYSALTAQALRNGAASAQMSIEQANGPREREGS